MPLCRSTRFQKQVSSHAHSPGLIFCFLCFPTAYAVGSVISRLTALVFRTPVLSPESLGIRARLFNTGFPLDDADCALYRRSLPVREIRQNFHSACGLRKRGRSRFLGPTSALISPQHAQNQDPRVSGTTILKALARFTDLRNDKSLN